MDTNLGQAATAVATVRRLPGLAPWQFLRPIGSGTSAAPVQVTLKGRTLPTAGTYGVSALATTMTACVTDVLGVDADHTFSTRLGPSASPPV
jgi:hypothetical protein